MRAKLLILKAAGKLNAEAPEWIQVFRAGTVEIEDGEPAVMDAAGAKAIIDYFERLKHDMVVDYEHQTLTGEQSPAAGWIRALEWRGIDGLWAKVDWTDKAAAYIASGEYRYHSPVFVVREGDRKITKLYNVALTNQPRTIGIAALAAKNIGMEIEQGDARMFEKLCALLGLDPATATEDDVTAAVEKMVADMAAAAEAAKNEPAPVAAKSVLAALDLPENVTVETVIAKLESFKAPATAAAKMSGELIALKAEIAGIKAKELINTAVSEGKITPDELEKWGTELAKSNPEQFRLIVLSRQRGSMIPVDGLPASKVVAGAAITDEDMEVCKQLGISPDDWKKYNGKATK